MVIRAIEGSVKDTYQLLKLSFDSGSYTLTDWTSDVVGDEGLTYLSVPSMQVELPVNNGLLNNDDSAACKINLPLDDFLADLSCGLPFAPVTITVRELIKPLEGGALAASHTTFIGRLMRSVRNPQGRSAEVALYAMSAKARLNVPLGIPCNPQCENTLGDPSCKVAPLPFAFGTIHAIDGKELTISGIGVATQADRFWQRGYLSHNGLNLMIRDWRLADPTKFYLTRQPPDSWLLANVVLVVGCDKSIQTCRDRFNNESNFLGLGIAIPSYHPLLSPGDA